MSNKYSDITSYKECASDWAQLAEQDPEAFEAMREKLVGDYIKSTPTDMQQRLECMQWKIDHIRRRADTPAEAFTAITRMMWESTQKLARSQQDLLDACNGKVPKTLARNREENILSFRRVARR